MPRLNQAGFPRRLADVAINRRRLVQGAAAGALAPALLQGRPAAAQDLSGEITVWTWPDNDKTFEKTIPIFQTIYPDVTVKVEAFGNDTYHDKLLTALVSGSGPDVAMVEIGNVAKFKDKPGFVDLAQEPYNAAQFAEGYVDFAWGYVSDQESGRVFTLPKNTGPGGLFYRRDIFEEVGLPTPPEEVQGLLATWDDLITVGQEVVVEGERWMVSSPGQIFNAILAQAGVSYFNEAGELQLQDPAYKAALEYVQQATEAGIISPFDDWSPEWGASLESGGVAVHLWGNWFGGLLKSVYAQGAEGKWGVAAAPAYNEVSAYNSGGDFIGILEASDKKDIGWAFVQFVTQDPESLKTMYLENDLYPAWHAVLTAEWMNTEDPYYAGQNVNTVFSVVSEQMQPPITNPNDPVVNQALDDALISVAEGKATVDEALAQAEEQIKSSIG
ncbi:MAG: ABC transporter substrate-binding protein [Thermomicrobiales bacterium]